MSNILTITDLEKKYEGKSEKLTVLNKLNLQIQEGSSNVIVGTSGSGKSTLLNIVGGIDNATGGKIVAGKWNVTELSEKELAKYRLSFVGFVFQFHYLLKDFTALENVYLPYCMAGGKKKDGILKAKQLICDVGLEKRMDHLPSELSGGERQRIAVARALINDPSLILADEPTGNLDPGNAGKIGELLFSMSEKYRKTLLLVTHDFSIASMGQNIFALENGGVIKSLKERRES
ncbi:MAG: ABC transporter ATP-binding protein [Treponema sp.]|nr:ABC transporter ATP-binding protein [Treponema sp.]